MEELAEQLEDSLYLIKQENKRADFHCQAIGKLLRPWKRAPSASEQSGKEEAQEQNEQQSSVVNKEISEIDSLLKKAKLVRTSKIPKPTTAARGGRMKANPQAKARVASGKENEALRSSSASRKKGTAKSTNYTTDKRPTTAAASLKEQNLLQKNLLGLKSPDSESSSSHLNLEDVVNKEQLPKDLRRYDSFYTNLKQNQVFSSHSLYSAPSEAEHGFVEALCKSASTPDNKLVLTLSLAVKMTQELSELCNRLVCVLNSEHIRYNNSSRSSPAQRYRYELVVERVLSKVEDIQRSFRYILNSNICPDGSRNDLIHDNTLRLSSLHPSAFFSYQETKEAASFYRELNQLKSLKFIREVKKAAMGPLLETLKKVPEVLDFEKGEINPKFIQVYKATYALLAQDGSSILPAILWNP